MPGKDSNPRDAPPIVYLRNRRLKHPDCQHYGKFGSRLTSHPFEVFACVPGQLQAEIEGQDGERMDRLIVDRWGQDTGREEGNTPSGPEAQR